MEAYGFGQCFCVAKDINWLLKKGVYAGALTKKHRYCPIWIIGNIIDTQFQDKG